MGAARLPSTAESTGPLADDGHEGTIGTQQASFFAMAGLSNRFNALVIVPYMRWSQVAHQQDNHHRTEIVEGFRDVRLGLRYVAANTRLGPGERLFLGLTLALPTATSYETNPFADNADSVRHRHFALGSGTSVVTFHGEWWHRSEFPWVTGLLARISPRPPTSALGNRPGGRLELDLHAIGHTHRLWRSYPYLTLGLRWAESDAWEGTSARNSGGLWVEGSAGLDLELTESISGVLRLSGPLWTSLNGSQHITTGINLTIRYTK